MDKKKAKVIKSFIENDTNVSKTCRACNISRKTFYLWKEQDEEFAALVDDCEEAITDEIEGLLRERVRELDTTAIIFFLKTKGKKRGYVEKQEIKVQDDIEFHLKFGE
jgi:hypothetical protein